MRDEEEIQRYLDLEIEKRLTDETIVHNEKSHDDQTANGKDFDKDAYTIENQELLEKRSEIRVKTEAFDCR